MAWKMIERASFSKNGGRGLGMFRATLSSLWLQERMTFMAGTRTNEPRNPRTGLDALLTPDNCALMLIDHQPFQFAGVRSHDTQTVINNVVGLAIALALARPVPCTWHGGCKGHATR